MKYQCTCGASFNLEQWLKEHFKKRQLHWPSETHTRETSQSVIGARIHRLRYRAY